MQLSTRGLLSLCASLFISSKLNHNVRIIPVSKILFGKNSPTSPENEILRKVRSFGVLFQSCIPVVCFGSKLNAVSSRTSRLTASISVSPDSKCPAGWLSLTPSLVFYSTSKNLPSRSAMAATVTFGFQTISCSLMNCCSRV